MILKSLFLIMAGAGLLVLAAGLNINNDKRGRDYVSVYIAAILIAICGLSLLMWGKIALIVSIVKLVWFAV